MSALIDYVKAENIRISAWVNKDPTNRWAGGYSEDIEHWNERGIHTVEQLQRNELETQIYDLTKSLYHYRVSNETLKKMTLQELEAEANKLGAEMSDYLDEEKKRQVEVAEKFEIRIKETMELVSGTDRQRAIEIIADAEGISKEELGWYGFESLEYELGLKYGYIKKSLEN